MASAREMDDTTQNTVASAREMGDTTQDTVASAKKMDDITPLPVVYKVMKRFSDEVRESGPDKSVKKDDAESMESWNAYLADCIKTEVMVAESLNSEEGFTDIRGLLWRNDVGGEGVKGDIVAALNQGHGWELRNYDGTVYPVNLDKEFVGHDNVLFLEREIPSAMEQHSTSVVGKNRLLEPHENINKYIYQRWSNIR